MPALGATTWGPVRPRAPGNGGRASPGCSTIRPRRSPTMSDWSVRLACIPARRALIRALLRPDDRLACCELHPEDACRACVASFAHDRQVAVHHRDAWEALGALLPPEQRRGLVLIDPPYEDPQEFDATGRRPRRSGMRRFGTGVFAAWYPIKHRAPVRGFLRPAAGQLVMRDIVAAELWLREPVDPTRLNGCGMLVINPPYRFEQEVPPILDALLDRLGNREAWRRRRASRGSPMSSVVVIGAGAWGTALAIQAARAGNGVTLWARDPAPGADHRRRAARTRACPAIACRTRCRSSMRLPDRADVALLAVPMQHLARRAGSACRAGGAARRLHQGRRERHAAPAAGDRGRAAARHARRRADRPELRPRDRRRPAGRRGGRRRRRRAARQ